MKVFALALTLGLAATPLQAQQAAGDNAYDNAVAARLRGDPAEAVRLLEPLVAADPQNADAQVQLGYAYLGLDRPDDAAVAFEAALALAPQYADARLGLARAALQRNDRAGALEQLRLLGPGNADGAALRSQIEAQPMPTRWALDFDASYAAVEDSRPDWKEGALQLRYTPNADFAVAGRIQTSRRFGLTDTYLEAVGERAIGERVRAYALLGGTADADFRPRWQAGIGGSVRVTDGPFPTVLTLDLRHAEFATGDVQSVNPGIEQYVLGGRAWLTARWINTFAEDDRHLSGYLLRGDVLLNDGLRVFAGYSNAPDTSEGVVVDTRGYFGGLSVDLTPGVTARLSAAVEKSDTAADRTQVALGLGWRF